MARTKAYECWDEYSCDADSPEIQNTDNAGSAAERFAASLFADDGFREGRAVDVFVKDPHSQRVDKYHVVARIKCYYSSEKLEVTP